MVLSVEGLSISYGTRRGPVLAVRDVSLELRRGETLAVIGESGSGKTTLALGLIRLTPRAARITSGRILYQRGGRVVDVRTLSDGALRRHRWSECALVFQSALNAFNPVLTVWEQFLDTAGAHTRWPRSRVRARASELLDLVHLDPVRVLGAYPHELSGGMRQRVLLALGLLLEPPIVILDEPTTALDILTQRSIIDLLRTLKQRLGFSMIFISHDLSLAAELADRVVTMYAGRIVESAGVDDLFYRPRHPYSLGLLRAVPKVSGALGTVASIPGSPPDLIRLPRGCSYHPRCPFGVEACLEAEPPLEPVDAPHHAAACIRWEAVAEAADTAGRAPDGRQGAATSPLVVQP
jgi:peptide/nickel transport system ATP-binding protein